MELLQYSPTTPTVHAVPLLMSPPWINKYYVMDLAPGRSFAEWAIKHGHTVFQISYRNPDKTMGDTRLDDYLLEGPRTALDVINDILAWNEDGTRMPAAMHSFYLRSCYIGNQLAKGEMVLDGTRLNLGDIKEDAYVLSAKEDHIAPWTASYKTTQLLPGKVRYVL